MGRRLNIAVDFEENECDSYQVEQGGISPCASPVVALLRWPPIQSRAHEMVVDSGNSRTAVYLYRYKISVFLRRGGTPTLNLPPASPILQVAELGQEHHHHHKLQQRRDSVQHHRDLWL